jgi:nucleoside-diphosphate-sugar epimerase
VAAVARTAFILGGTGMIGRAAVRRLLEDGWDVTVASRGEQSLPSDLADIRTVQVDREHDDLAAVVGDRVDLLIDVIPYRLEDGKQLLGLRGHVGSVIAISSASVYADDEGNSIDEAREAGREFPHLAVPIPEQHRTVEPGDATYSTRKVAIEQALLGEPELRATILRPCAIYGPGATLPREWFFVKRVLDRRRIVPFAFRGESRFHTTAAENLAELIRLAAARPRRRVLNCGDPDPPTVVRIARAIGRVLEWEFTEVLLPGAPVDSVGRNPWAVPRPIVVDMAEAELQLGYRPVARYERDVARTCEWLVAATKGHDWHAVFPRAAEYMAEHFDYDAEDEYVTAQLGSAQARPEVVHET